jgi:hypothetical protein
MLPTSVQINISEWTVKQLMHIVLPLPYSCYGNYLYLPAAPHWIERNPSIFGEQYFYTLISWHWQYALCGNNNNNAVMLLNSIIGLFFIHTTLILYDCLVQTRFDVSNTMVLSIFSYIDCQSYRKNKISNKIKNSLTFLNGKIIFRNVLKMKFLYLVIEVWNISREIFHKNVEHWDFF